MGDALQALAQKTDERLQNAERNRLRLARKTQQRGWVWRRRLLKRRTRISNLK